MPELEATPGGAIYLAGPTAVGKSRLALEIARQLGGEMMSVDSMQVYQGLDIGTAKASASDQDEVPHHLIDIVPLDHPFDVQQFLTRTADVIPGIKRRQHVPIFCGGTGLYFKAFLEGLDPLPPPDPALRKTLENTPTEALLEELRENDPRRYQSIDRQNPRRIIRAVEILRLSSQSPSDQRTSWSRENPRGRLIVLSRQPDELRHRIHDRVDQMMGEGLIEETQNLLTRGLRENPIACQALGYRQVIEYLEGQYSKEDTIQRIKTKTWQFARRQLTWFRKQPHTKWIDLSGTSLRQQLAAILQPSIPSSP